MTGENAALIALGCFGLGLSVGLAALLLASRGALQFLASLNPWITRGFVGAIGLASIAMLLITNREPAPTAAQAPMPTAGMAAGASPGSAGSMDSATQALAARLAANGGSDEDWNLLAQSYEFLGRSEDAALARQHKVSGERSLLDAVAATAPVRPVAPQPSAMPSTPASSGVAALLARAEDHRRKREFRQACDVYRQVIAAGGMTADSWADYADALASAAPGGSLAGEPAKALEQALKLDPKQTKALWLKASLAHEQHRYDEALATWRALLALMPPGSSDARIIEANIAEAQRLAGKKG
jgi:cytochrome c-type biogenesis protein CcmH/NrfG